MELKKGSYPIMSSTLTKKIIEESYAVRSYKINTKTLQYWSNKISWAWFGSISWFPILNSQFIPWLPDTSILRHWCILFYFIFAETKNFDMIDMAEEHASSSLSQFLGNSSAWFKSDIPRGLANGQVEPHKMNPT